MEVKMKTINILPPEYANRPNLWRVACELSRFKDPYKATDTLLATLQTGMKERPA